MENDTPTPERKHVKKGLLIILLPLVLIAAAIAVFMLWPANVSREEAREIALIHVNGDFANRPERDFEQFQRVWSVEVVADNMIYEVYVSMRTGEVIRLEVERRG